MIKNIKVYPRYLIESYIEKEGTNFPFSNWYLISIYGHDYPLLTKANEKIMKNFGLLNSMQFEFWDINEQLYKSIKSRYPDAVLFNEDIASDIVNFIKTINTHTKDSTLVIHCSAGISRSGAVGTFACDYYGLDYNNFIKSNPYIKANQYVLSLLRKVSGTFPIATQNGIAPVDKNEIIFH